MEIKLIEKVPHCGDCPICEEGFTYSAFDKIEVRQLEADFKEAIEALELLMKGVDGLPPLTAIANALTEEWRVCQGVVEKAYGESWEDIRREK